MQFRGGVFQTGRDHGSLFAWVAHLSGPGLGQPQQPASLSPAGKQREGVCCQLCPVARAGALLRGAGAALAGS